MKAFDLDRAKAGEPICNSSGVRMRYVDGPNKHGTVCVQYGNIGNYDSYNPHDLFMVEGGDVHPGDVFPAHTGTNRNEFEAFAQSQYEKLIDFSLEWQGNCYLNDELDAMWVGYQAGVADRSRGENNATASISERVHNVNYSRIIRR